MQIVDVHHRNKSIKIIKLKRNLRDFFSYITYGMMCFSIFASSYTIYQKRHVLENFDKIGSEIINIIAHGGSIIDNAFFVSSKIKVNDLEYIDKNEINNNFLFSLR